MFKKFIQRPVLAIVISVIIVFMGLLAIKQLPISQFPEIAPTTVNIFIAYPGSSADVLVKSTLIPLETAIKIDAFINRIDEFETGSYVDIRQI